MKHTMMFRYDETIRRGLEAIKERDGTPFHEQVRRAVLQWIAAKGAPETTAPHTEKHEALAARVARLVEGE